MTTDPPDGTLDADRYDAVRALAIVAAMSASTIALDDLDALIATAERSSSIAPYIDPTLYLQGADKLDEEIRVFRALREFRRELETFNPAGGAQ